MQTEPPREVLDMFTLLPLRWRGRRRCKNSSTTNYRSSVLVLATRTQCFIARGDEPRVYQDSVEEGGGTCRDWQALCGCGGMCIGGRRKSWLMVQQVRHIFLRLFLFVASFVNHRYIGRQLPQVHRHYIDRDIKSNGVFPGVSVWQVCTYSRSESSYMRRNKWGWTALIRENNSTCIGIVQTDRLIGQKIYDATQKHRRKHELVII